MSEEIKETISEDVNSEETTSSDRHENTDPYSKEEVYDKDKEYVAVQIPSAKYSTLMKMLDIINDMDQDKLKDMFSEKDLLAAGLNSQTTGLTNKKDVYYDKMNNDTENWVNDINYSDKKLNIDSVNIKAKGKLSGGIAASKFISSLGIGKPTVVTLWHSGFNVTIKPPLDSDLVKLEMEIADNEITLGRLTNTLIYSNYSVILVRLVVDFIVEHIISSSLEIPNDKDIRDYIKTPDLYLLVLGLIKSKYPLGYDIIKTCKNSVIIEDDKPLCNFTASAKIDPKWLLRVDRKSLTPNMLKQVSMKRPNSISVDEVKEYQLALDTLKERVFTVTVNGVDVNITLKTPSLATYIDNGEEWIENIISKAEEIFTESDTVELKNKKITQILNSTILGIYNIYIDKITVEDDIYDEREDINTNIDLLSSDDKIFKIYIEEITKYISDSVIAIAATPAFICDVCKENNRDGEQNTHDNEVFKEFIPLNVLEHFFDLGGLRVTRIQNRDIS